MTARKDTRIHLVAELEKLLPGAGSIKASKIRHILAEATRGELHDFKSSQVCGKMYGSALLRDAGCAALASRLEDGEFDETADAEDQASMALDLKDSPELLGLLKLPVPISDGVRSDTRATSEPHAHEHLRAISSAIERAVRSDDKTLFFAAFLEMPSGVAYVSNGARAEVQRLLPELVNRIAGHGPGADVRALGTLPSEHADARLSVERRCGTVGRSLTEGGMRLALFVFKNDGDCPDGVGVNAWFSSLPGADVAIRAWLSRGKA